MSKSKEKGSRKRIRPVRLLMRLIGGLVIVLLVLVLTVVLGLEPGILWFVNSRLGDMLQTEVHLNDVNVAFLTGELEVNGLSVAQPKGFEGDALLELDWLRVKVDLASLQTQEIVVEAIDVSGLRVVLERNAEEKMNVEALAPAETSQTNVTEDVQEAEESPSKPEDAAPADAPAVRLARVSVDRTEIRYIDHALAEEALVVDIKDINLQVKDLVLDPAGTAGPQEPARVELRAQLVQPKVACALMAMQARMGVVGAGVPEMNMVFITAGLELATFRPVVPPGTGKALGGDAMDLSVALTVSPSLLDVLVSVHTFQNKVFRLKVGGTPDKPVVDTSAVLFTVLSRFGGGIGGMVGNVADGTMAVAGTAVDAAQNVGKGVLNTAGSLKDGVFSTVGSLARADLKGVAKGVKDTVVDTTTSAADTVVDSGQGVIDGAAEAGEKTAGLHVGDAWRKATPQRWVVLEEKATALFKEMPFPPQRLGEVPELDAGEEGVADADPDPVAEVDGADKDVATPAEISDRSRMNLIE